MAAFLAQAFAFLLGKFVGLAQVLIAIAVAIFVGAWLLGTDLASWIFEQVLNVVIGILNTFSLSLDFLNITNYISGLPPEVVNIMGLLGVGQAIGIIIAAIVVKITLQLIPFTRLGG